MPEDQRQRREQDFWGHHLPSVDHCVARFRIGPDPNTGAMLEAVEPVRGARVLDFACGAGLVSAWLAARGADVVALDLSPESVERSRQVLGTLGLPAQFVTGVWRTPMNSGSSTPSSAATPFTTPTSPSSHPFSPSTYEQVDGRRSSKRLPPTP